MELYRKYRAAQGRHKKAALDGYCKVFVMSDEVSDTKEMHEKLEEALADAEEWKDKYEDLEKETYELYVSMAQEINAHETEKENFEKELTTPLANKGHPLDLSPRQQSRKLKRTKN